MKMVMLCLLAACGSGLESNFDNGLCDLAQESGNADLVICCGGLLCSGDDTCFTSGSNAQDPMGGSSYQGNWCIAPGQIGCYWPDAGYVMTCPSSSICGKEPLTCYFPVSPDAG